MAIKKKKKKNRLSRIFICTTLVFASLALIYSGFKEVQTGMQIRANIEENTAKSTQLDEKKKELEKTKENLTNPDYIEYLARGKYLVTKDGEQVFKFSDTHN